MAFRPPLTSPEDQRTRLPRARHAAHPSPRGAVAVGACIAVFLSAMGVHSSAGVDPAPSSSATDVNSVPVTQPGNAAVVLTTSWDPSEATLDPGSAIAPTGWALEYSQDGTTWSTTEPVDTTAIESVRASGSVPSQGDGGDSNTLRSSELSADVTGSPLDFGASSGGDGYDVAFPDANRVINVYHHNGTGQTVTIDCKLRTTGEICPEGKISFDDDDNPNNGPGPYLNPNNSRVTVHAPTQRAYTPAVRRSDNTLGFLCADYSIPTPAKCQVEFIPVSTRSSISTLNGFGGIAFDDSKFFVVDAMTSRLYCLDMATTSICPGFEQRVENSSTVDGFLLPLNAATAPYGGFGWSWTSDISVADGKVYFFHGNGSNITMGCVDPTTPAFCTGAINTQPTQAGFQFDFPPFPLYDTTGSSVLAICVIYNRICIDPNGAEFVPMPQDLSDFLDPATPDGIDRYANVPLYFSLFEWGIASNRLFFQVEAGGNACCPDWVGDIACWDFETALPCDFGSNGDEAGIIYDHSPANNLYSFVADPYIDCIWSNSDSGYIISIGTDGGTCGGDDSASVFAFDEDDARLDCDTSSDPIRWTELDLTLPEGLDLASLRLTVKNGDGDPVTGWDHIPVTSTTVDLSNLDLDDTGPSPTFDISFANTGLDVASEVTAELRYVTPPPELCLELVPIAACTLGQAVDGRLPAPPVDVTHSKSITIEAVVTNEMETVSLEGATYDAETQCGLGALEGTATSVAGGSPVSGALVTLRDPVTGLILATATTDGDGYYKFDFLTPGTYTVEFSDVTGQKVTPETRTSSPLVVVDETTRADGLYEGGGGLPSIDFDFVNSLEHTLLPATR